MDEQSKEISLQRILGVLGFFGCLFIYYQFSTGVWVNPWNLLPGWLSQTGLIGFVISWLFSSFYFLFIFLFSPLFFLIFIMSLFSKKNNYE